MSERNAVPFEEIENGEVFEDIETGFAMVKTMGDYSGQFSGMEQEVDFNAVALGDNLVTYYEPDDVVSRFVVEE
jgi:hypothetical protein